VPIEGVVLFKLAIGLQKNMTTDVEIDVDQYIDKTNTENEYVPLHI
jgi:hypothetical protein